MKFELVSEIKTYEYPSNEDMKNHMEEMISNGWEVTEIFALYVEYTNGK